jgi:hypothetical protein
MCHRIGVATAAVLSVFATVAVHAATLEKLTLEEMAQESTLIVRGRVTGCSGEPFGPAIYTRCAITVSEGWKGNAGEQVVFYIPGGTVGGLSQIVSGAPKVGTGEEYVLFLWAGRSGMNQVIGLSQGVFDLRPDSKGQATASRAASSEVMLDKSGNAVKDSAVEVRVFELRKRVAEALAGAAK